MPSPSLHPTTPNTCWTPHPNHHPYPFPFPTLTWTSYYLLPHPTTPYTQHHQNPTPLGGSQPYFYLTSALIPSLILLSSTPTPPYISTTCVLPHFTLPNSSHPYYTHSYPTPHSTVSLPNHPYPLSHNTPTPDSIPTISNTHPTTCILHRPTAHPIRCCPIKHVYLLLYLKPWTNHVYVLFFF